MKAHTADRSRRITLIAMAPGDTVIFPAPVAGYRSLAKSITSDLALHLNDVKTEYSMRKALLVFDETETPIACCVVTRSKEST